MAEGSGSNPKKEEALLSASPSQDNLEAGQRPRILIVDDNLADIIIVREALSEHKINAETIPVGDGEQMMNHLKRIAEHQEARPSLVLLDLNLPRVSGHELLRHMRETPALRHIPVIVITSSDAPRDRSAVANLGAEAYFRKPADYDDFLKLGKLVQSVLGQQKS